MVSRPVPVPTAVALPAAGTPLPSGLAAALWAGASWLVGTLLHAHHQLPGRGDSAPQPGRVASGPGAQGGGGCAGDINLDGLVDLRDFQLLAADYGHSGAAIGTPRADVNGDGTVDLRDFQLLAADYGQPCATATPTATASPTASPSPTVLPSATPTRTPPTPFARPLPTPPVLTGSAITLVAQEADIPVLDGPPTRMWTFNGTFPGPTIRRPTGQTTQVTVINNLPGTVGSLTIHHHGSNSSPENDGQPADYLIPPGGSRTYTYTGREGGGNERGAIHFYHDHRDMLTGRNVWMGLVGMYLLEDPADPPSLPAGEFDVPLILTDRSFDANNQLVYQFNIEGLEGERVLVNGALQPYFEVGDRRYRFRILNASNFRDYDLALSNGQPILQIGTESGLLPAPVARQRIRLGPAERADVVIDFAGALGQQLVLRNLAGPPSELLQFRVTRHLTDTSVVPATLRALPDFGTPAVTRTFQFNRSGSQWTINGRVFDHHRVDAQPVRGVTERWIFQNPGNWKHLVHIHGADQLLVSRNGAPPADYERLKETWYLAPGETVEVLIRFPDYLGRYVLHCHLLEHEDAGMMAQFEVVAPPSPAPPLTFTLPPPPEPRLAAVLRPRREDDDGDGAPG
ncbi:MAG TPA: multicopper oxidase domain-containing protein [Chloroflexota bacterium]|nr:multicopper oxidase domain-containing protein [Chloroflexota bacterium]